MSEVQCNIYRLLVQASGNDNDSDSSVQVPRQGNRRWENANLATSLPSLPSPSSRTDDECPLCEEDDRDLHEQQCCGFRSCNECLRRHMVFADQWRGCPNPECGAVLSAQDQSCLLEGFCCICAEGDERAPLLPIECGFGHEVHAECMQDHIAGFLRAKKFPLLCPAYELCKCPLPEKLVLECLSEDTTVETTVSPLTSLVATVAPQTVTAASQLLHQYYDLAIERATAAHRNHVQCPNPRCRQEIDLGPSSGARTPGSRAIHCGHCMQSWCGTCHQNAHEGMDCESFSELRMQWLQFVGSHSSSQAGELERQLRNHQNMIASERFKAQNMRHCPHCGLEVFRTDGCSDVTCGRDASDKGNKLHSNLGCGEHFNWNEARPYRAKVTVFTPTADATGDVFKPGLVLPPRLCRMCFEVCCWRGGCGLACYCIHAE